MGLITILVDYRYITYKHGDIVKSQVATIYTRPIFQGYVMGYPPELWSYIVQYLHFFDPEILIDTIRFTSSTYHVGTIVKNQV